MVETYLLLLIAALAICFTQVAAKCSCNAHDQHPQTQFCKAHFAIKATIINQAGQASDSSSEAMVQYKIKVLEVFKWESKVSSNKVDTFILTPEIGSCSQLFTAKLTYIIIGVLTQSGKLFTTSCFLNQIWNSIPPAQIEGVQGRYGQNCNNCQIKVCQKEDKIGNCHIPWCCGQINTYNPSNECLLVSDFPRTSVGWCYKRYSFCEKHKSGKCIFTKTTALTSCIEGQEEISAIAGKSRKQNVQGIMKTINRKAKKFKRAQAAQISSQIV